jgi:hypothetical protein
MKITRKIEIEFIRRITRTITTDDPGSTRPVKGREMTGEMPKGFLTDLLGQGDSRVVSPGESPSNKEK